MQGHVAAMSINETCSIMEFALQGHVAVMNINKEMLSLLGKGGFFGELALLATARRTAQVRTAACLSSASRGLAFKCALCSLCAPLVVFLLC